MEKEVKEQNEVVTKEKLMTNGDENLKQSVADEKNVLSSTLITKAVLLKSEMERKRQEIVAANKEIANIREEMQRLEKIERYDDMSKDIKDIHDSLMNHGFSDDQAFQLVIKMIDSVNSKASNNPYYLR